MDHSKRKKYIDALKRQLPKSSGLELQSIKFKIEKLSKNQPFSSVSTSNLITKELMHNLITTERHLLEGYNKINSSHSNEKLEAQIHISHLKILFMTKELTKKFPGEISKLEKINGEVSITVKSTEFDPLSEIEILGIYLSNSTEPITLKLSSISKTVNIPFHNTSKVEMMLFDKSMKALKAVAILPSLFFIDKHSEEVTISFDLFHSVTFQMEYKRRIQIDRFSIENRYYVQYGHLLEKNTLFFPVYCVVCKGMCLMFTSLYKCVNCNTKAHTGCMPFLIFKCQKCPSSNIKNNYNINHNLVPSRSSGMRFCNHCGERIGISDKMLQCKSCGDKFHERCEESIFNSCGASIDLITKIAELKVVVPKLKDTGFDYSIIDFELVRVLGRGAYGKVFLAKNKAGEEIALKTIKKDSITSRSELKYIKFERIALEEISKIKNNFVTQLKCYFEDNKFFYFGINYYPCGDLMFHLSQRNFSENQIRLYAAELIIGLEFIHNHNMAYRDLKLDNILLTEEGHAVICDFGLCKMNMSGESTTFTYCGTLNYMAPEVIQGSGYNKSVDFWSLGVCLYEMFHKEPPFFGITTKDLVESITGSSIIFSSRISRNGLDFMNSLLHKDPNKRLGNGQDGIYKIKTHPWFDGLNWDDVSELKVEPEFKPSVGSLSIDKRLRRLKPELSLALSVLNFDEQLKKV